MTMPEENLWILMFYLIKDQPNCLCLLTNLNIIPSNCVTWLNSPSPRPPNFEVPLILGKYWEIKQVLEHGKSLFSAQNVLSNYLIRLSPQTLSYLFLFILPFLPDLWDAYRSCHVRIFPITVVQSPSYNHLLDQTLSLLKIRFVFCLINITSLFHFTRNLKQMNFMFNR